MGICVILGLKGRIEVWKNRYLEGSLLHLVEGLDNYGIGKIQWKS